MHKESSFLPKTKWTQREDTQLSISDTSEVVEFYDARLKYQLGELIQVDLNSTQFYLDSVCLLLMEASLDTGGKTVAEIKERNKKTWEEFEKQAK